MRLWIAAFLLSMISVSAWAQQDQVLRGFASARLVIEDLDENAKSCGVTESALDTSARFVLSQSRIKIDPSPSGPFIYIATNVMRLSNRESCVYSYILSFNAAARVVANNVVASTEIWSTSGVGIAPRSNTPRVLTEAIDAITKRFVVEWSKVN
jgi:hypothetical protein